MNAVALAPVAPGFPLTDRLAVMRLGRRLADPSDKRLRGCGWPVAAGGPGLMLAEGGRFRGGQRALCDSPLRCGYCSPFQWAVAESRGVELTRRHVELGGWVGHVVLTVPHRRSDPLGLLTDVLMGGWRARRGWRGVSRARASIGRVAEVAVLHVKVSGGSGWHPHLHTLWFCVGDEGCWECFVDELSAAWSARISAELGRPVPAGRGVYASVRSAELDGDGVEVEPGRLVRTSSGLWRYVRPDDADHPDHPRFDGGWRSDDLWDEFDATDESDDGWGRRADEWERPSVADPWALGAPSLEVLSQVGPLAVGGDGFARAALAHYLRAMRGRSRVVSWRALSAAYGDVSVARVEPEPGPRLWVHPGVVAELEKLPPSLAGDPLSAGLALADPWAAADLWAAALGVELGVARHVDDGAPVVGRPQDLDRNSAVELSGKVSA